MTPEGKVKDALKKRLKTLDWGWNMKTTRGFGASGHADFTINAHGLYVEVETKANGCTPTALQHQRLKTTASRFGLGYVLGSNALRGYWQEPGLMRIEGEILLANVTQAEVLDALIEHIYTHHHKP